MLTPTEEKRRRRFKRVRVQLMRSEEFCEVAPVMMLGKTEIVDDVPTACTNGRDEKYGAAFVDQLADDRYLGFVIMHENFVHKMHRHLTVYRKLYDEDPILANMACDYWGNGKLVKIDPHGRLIAMPRGDDGKPIGLLDERFDNKSVLEIFRILKKEKEEGKEQPGDGGSGLDDHDWDGASEMSEKEKELLAQDIEQAIREGQMAAKKAGRGGRGDPLGLDELLRPRIDWLAQLRQFVRSTCRKREVSTFRRLNRRFLAQDMAMPSLQGKSVKKLVLAPDASGSMFYSSSGPAPWVKCMSEVEGLVRQLNVDELHVIYWDYGVTKHEVYTPATVKRWKDTTKPKGGGGTDPSCVAAYLKENRIKADAVIVLTDGDLTAWGRWTQPLLWVITDRKTTAPVGKTIHMTED